MIGRNDAYVLRRVLADRSVNGELEAASRPVRRLVERLAALPKEARGPAFECYLCAHDDADAIKEALSDIDPDLPPPEVEAARRFATAADVRRLLSGMRWTWDGWIPAARIFGIAAFEGTGKTRFILDLHRRAYLGLCWPDGQAATLAAGRPALWLCSDGHQDELAELLPAFGLPDDSIVFPAPPDEPYAGTDLDSPETLAAVEDAVAAVNPWCVFIDTLTNATQRNLCAQDQMMALKTPLLRWTQTYGVNVGLSLHLSREGQPLGRRIKGITRTVIHLECPDAEKQPGRLRLWVDKSFAKKPPPLGVTMGEGGNDYDSTPPAKTPTATRRPGPPPVKLNECKSWLRERLAAGASRLTDVRGDAEAAGYCADTLYSAMREMGVEESTEGRRKWWRLPPFVGDVGDPDSDNGDNSDTTTDRPS